MNAAVSPVSMVVCVWRVLVVSRASVPLDLRTPCVVPTLMSVRALHVSMGEHVLMGRQASAVSVPQVLTLYDQIECRACYLKLLVVQ